MSRRWLYILFTLAAGLCFADSEAPADWTFKDLKGVVQRPLDPGVKLGAVLVFFWHDCPISNSYVPELNRVATSHTNFAFYIVQVDSDLTVEVAREHARKFDLQPPVLLDPEHRLVKRLNATVTPEAVVVARNGGILYRGRIDDHYAALEKKRATVTRQDLIEALDAIAAGKPVRNKETKAIGCLIQ